MKRPPQTIEQTDKSWKFVQLIGLLLFLLCFTVWLFALGSAPAGNRATIEGMVATVSGLGAAVGFCLWIGGRMGAWWDHG